MKLDIRELAKNKVLCSRVFYKGEVYETNIRFGIGIDCFIEDKGITLKYYDNDKIQKYSNQTIADDYLLQYEEIEKVELSISRKPVSKLFLDKPYNYSLDLIIYPKVGHRIYLETNTFTIIGDICKYLCLKEVTVLDPINIVDKYHEEDYQNVKEKLNNDYDKLKQEYDLVNYRITDQLK